MTVSVKDYFQTIFIMLKVRMRANFNTTIGILFCLMLSPSPFTNSKQREKRVQKTVETKQVFHCVREVEKTKYDCILGALSLGSPAQGCGAV